MSTDEQESKQETEFLRPDTVAPVDEPEQSLHPDETDRDTGSAGSPYPDGPAGSSPYPDGWGPHEAAREYGHRGSGSSYGKDSGSSPAPFVDSYPPIVPKFDPAADFEPPHDLPPWYEDEYYDDRDWERLPRGTSTVFRAMLFLGVFVTVLAVTALFVKGWVDDQLDPPGSEGAVVVVDVPQGASTNDIARILGEEGVVANGTVFRYYLKFKDEVAYQAGEYEFRVNMAVWDVRDVLERGPTPVTDLQEFVTIPEGLNLSELSVLLLEKIPDFDTDELDEAISSVALPDLFEGVSISLNEGFLFPETYGINDLTRTDELSFVSRMVGQFETVASQVALADAPERVGLSPYQVLIVASLIEEEAQAEEDRAKIARVIYNRLEQGTPLGVDATVVYANDGDRVINQSDLEIDSPYNTRLYAGLPPTPISAPGRASIQAALNPDEGEWFYYVLTEENGPGTHTFAVTEAEFNAAVQVCIARDLGCS